MTEITGPQHFDEQVSPEKNLSLFGNIVIQDIEENKAAKLRNYQESWGLTDEQLLSVAKLAIVGYCQGEQVIHPEYLMSFIKEYGFENDPEVMQNKIVLDAVRKNLPSKEKYLNMKPRLRAYYDVFTQFYNLELM